MNKENNDNRLPTAIATVGGLNSNNSVNNNNRKRKTISFEDEVKQSKVAAEVTASEEEDQNQQNLDLAVRKRGKRKSFAIPTAILSTAAAPVQTRIHSQIPANEYHLHVSTELSDPQRLLQIILYSIQFNLSNTNSNTSSNSNSNKGTSFKSSGNESIDIIMNELVEELLQGRIECSWYKLSKKKEIIYVENPVNLDLKKRISGYEKVYQNLLQEEEFWRKDFRNEVKSIVSTQEQILTSDLSTSSSNVDHLEQPIGIDEGILSDVDTIEEKIYELDQMFYQLNVKCKEAETLLYDRFPKVVEKCFPSESSTSSSSRDYLYSKRKRFSILPMPIVSAEKSKDVSMDLLKTLASSKSKPNTSK